MKSDPPEPVSSKYAAPAVVPFLLELLALSCAAAPLKITIASDSTAAHFPPTDRGGRWGWGQALAEFFTTNVIVDDLASSMTEFEKLLQRRQVATNMDVPLLDVLPDSVAFDERIGRAKAAVYQAANTHTTPPTPHGDTTHFTPKGAREHCVLIVRRLLESTDPRLAPLRAQVRKQALVLRQ